ncbi:Uncharacterised protein [Salmonella bongori]|uniref:Uncharacterized protein n=1 Tax=Salmonella bongori N268-08 TaxID=1197719 RepID=S5MXU2_SALBN|nr:hypothetical protein A464_2328 [Salmonella bongori N268-08]VDZ77956.1 Uncharacterised protein [Salmonella bongori]
MNKDEEEGSPGGISILVSACVYVILCFTYNPWPVMKVSYNRAFVPEG